MSSTEEGNQGGGAGGSVDIPRSTRFYHLHKDEIRAKYNNDPEVIRKRQEREAKKTAKEAEAKKRKEEKEKRLQEKMELAQKTSRLKKTEISGVQ